MVIMAIAIFPSLEIIREAEKNSFDAKFAELCAGKARSLLSEITRSYKPGNTGGGDLSSLSKEEGGDDRNSYANIRYEWQCSAVDLSLDVAPASDLSDADKDAATKKREQQEKALDALDFKLDVLWSLLDTIHYHYVVLADTPEVASAANRGTPPAEREARPGTVGAAQA